MFKNEGRLIAWVEDEGSGSISDIVAKRSSTLRKVRTTRDIGGRQIPVIEFWHYGGDSKPLGVKFVASKKRGLRIG